MNNFHGVLQSPTSQEQPLKITFQIDSGRVRLFSDRRRIGSWDMENVHVRRESIFRFLVRVDDDDATYSFTPDDPSGFAASIDVEIDLADTKPRFGLAERLRQVAG